MKLLSQIPSWLKNKYILASVFFVCWMLFFDHNDIFLQSSRYGELKDLQESKAYYEEQIRKTQKEVENIRTNQASVEKIAREKYLMKKDNEELFIITPE